MNKINMDERDECWDEGKNVDEEDEKKNVNEGNVCGWKRWVWNERDKCGWMK